MTASKYLSIVCAVAAMSLLLFGAPAFSAIEADRGASVQSTDDPSAYLGLLGHDPVEVEHAQEEVLVTSSNQFANDLDEFYAEVIDVDVSVGDDDLDVWVAHHPQELPLSESDEITIGADGDRYTEATITMEYEGSGTSEFTTMTREYDIVYIHTAHGLWFAGVGQVHVEQTDTYDEIPAGTDLDVTVYRHDESQGVYTTESTLNTDDHTLIKQVLDPPKNSPILAVYVEGVGTYVHPNYEYDETDSVYQVNPAHGAGDGVIVTTDRLDLDEIEYRTN